MGVNVTAVGLVAPNVFDHVDVTEGTCNSKCFIFESVVAQARNTGPWLRTTIPLQGILFKPFSTEAAPVTLVLTSST